MFQFTKQAVIETYTAFINNWKTAKEAIKSTCQAKPAFARFLEVCMIYYQIYFYFLKTLEDIYETLGLGYFIF